MLTFGLISGVGTALHFAVLLASVEVLALTPLTGSVLGAICGMLFNYVAHYHLTFGSTAPHRRSLPLFVSGGIASIVLNALVMAALLTTGMNYVLAQVLTTVVVFAFNFLYAKHVAFRT
ncbi:GtrA family protein [Sinimarinibacterium thermocellulolyticum]|uniref:GtrA family protein n=1 Tax=Sinimarinibacterium thermocellulolyticum TaxID=3170016 RepID=A0ABV2A8Q2_9GAMM